MTDFLDTKKQEIHARLRELRPLVDEFHRLEAAAAALDGVSGTPANGRRTSGGAGATRRPRATASTPKATGRRGRPRGSGTRSKQALELVRSRPGISIPEMAEAMGIQQNYLYRVLPSLQKDGMVKKQGRGWHARDAA